MGTTIRTTHTTDEVSKQFTLKLLVQSLNEQPVTILGVGESGPGMTLLP